MPPQTFNEDKMKFKNFVSPSTIAEAYELIKTPDTVILGGMMWMRMQSRTVTNAVDLSKLGLDKIEETEDGIRVGAYVTLRDAETSSLLNSYTHGAIKGAFAPIVGVQFRNTATVGGSVYGRFGFSDVTTLFTALGASIDLAGKGRTDLVDFVRDGAPKDLLTYVNLPKEAPDNFICLAHRNTATDFPVVSIAMCLRRDMLRITVTPAPLRGQTVDIALGDAKQNPEQIFEKFSFRADAAGSAEYRAHLCRVLITRGLDAIGG